jgi:hypothetical protein
MGLEEAAEESKDGQQEPVYVSSNERHVYKRMDVGMILLGLFVEDFQMYTIRHPEVNLRELLEKVINLDFSKSRQL